MFKILSTALILMLCVASYTQAANQPPAKPFQTKPMQSADKLKHPDMQPSNTNQKMTPPSDDMTPPDGNPPSKGKRPNKKPDKQPGGDKTPPELQ